MGLSIHLAEDVVPVGGTLRGEVRGAGDAPVSLRSVLHVKRADSGRVLTRDGSETPVEGGDPRPFTVPAPLRPCEFAGGRYVASLHWELEAKVGREKVSVPYRLVIAEDTTFESSQFPDDEIPGPSVGATVRLAVVLAAVAVGAVSGGAMSLAGGSWVTGGLLALVGVALGAVAVNVTRGILVARQTPGLRGPFADLGDERPTGYLLIGQEQGLERLAHAVAFQLQHRPAEKVDYRGEDVPEGLSVRLSLSPDAALTDLRAALVIEEIARLDDRERRNHGVVLGEIGRVEVPLVAAREPGRLDARLPIPRSDPFPTRGFKETGIRWSLEVSGTHEGERRSGRVRLDAKATRRPAPR